MVAVDVGMEGEEEVVVGMLILCGDTGGRLVAVVVAGGGARAAGGGAGAGTGVSSNEMSIKDDNGSGDIIFSIRVCKGKKLLCFLCAGSRI